MVNRQDRAEPTPSAPITEVQSSGAPPDGGYGWVCVGAQFFINGFTWGVAAVSYLEDSSSETRSDTGG